ncbi:MAG: insulinase family protein, partial [Cyanobacteria bacterium HKST-UBA06]|nr:insulinase family protein [Cyanobacteria bacterium HKST-UBA06]
ATFNAATSKDFTHFNITTSPQYFEEALKLHADMLLNANIPTPELDRERAVVQEEINRSLDSPFRQAFDLLMAGLFGPNHPYTRTTLGPKTNIANIPRQGILDYYHRWYQPANFRTVITGDVDTAVVLKQVEDAFKVSGSPRTAGLPAIETVEPRPASLPGAASFTDPNLNTVKYTLGFVTPGFRDKKTDMALDVAALVLGQGASSRLHKRLHEQLQLVDDISALNYTFAHNGLFLITSTLQPDKAEQAKPIILEEVQRLLAEGIDEAELVKAKTQTVKQHAFLTESSAGLASTIGNIVTIGELADFSSYVPLVEALTVTDVNEALRRVVTFDNGYLVEALPESMVKAAGQSLAEVDTQNRQALAQAAQAAAHGGAVDTATSELASRSPEAESGAVKEGTVVDYRLPGGARLLVKPTPSTHTVAVSVFARGGHLLEVKPGASTLTAGLMNKGTLHRDVQQWADELESNGIGLSVGSESDYMLVEGSAVADDFNHLLLLLEDMMAYPAFDTEQFDKVKTNQINILKASREQPTSLMLENLSMNLYPNHPYGLTGKRLEDAIDKVALADVKQFWHRQFSPDRLVISVVGPVEPKQVEAQMAQMMSALPRSEKSPVAGAAKPAKPVANPPAKELVVKDQKPEQAATWIGYGWLAPTIPQPNNETTIRDYASMKVINSLMGSGLSGRLFVELREKQGLAYEIGSFYPTRQTPGYFVMYLGTDPKNEGQVLQ